MLIRIKALKGYKLESLDGEIGKVEELYFEDNHWMVRYLVANTGNWLTGRQILIPPHALGQVKKDDLNITVNLTRKQIEDSPSIDTDKPVSRQFEEDLYLFFGWPKYWGTPILPGTFPHTITEPTEEESSIPPAAQSPRDPHLHSSKVVMGHHIQAVDGEIGHIDDMIVDDKTWQIRYLIADTRNWWVGRKVLISTEWVERLDWATAKASVHLSRDDIKKSPEYPDELPLTREYEDELHQHYHRPGYWQK
jgi:uncharacterized protein YrrD